MSVASSMSSQLPEERPTDEREPERSRGNGARAGTPPSMPPVESVPPPPPPSEGSLWWRLGGLVRTVRPHQWVKNVFVLAPIVFSKAIFDPLLLGHAAGAFAVFCLLAGAIYTINDVADVDADRQHPLKRYRPIASGRLPLRVARALSVLLVTAALVGAVVSSPFFFGVALGYFLLNVAYSLKLKHLAYVDVGCIATGFVLRVVGGGLATHIEVSNYLVVCTALLALFLGFGKRRHELTTAERRGVGQTRLALESYTQRGIDLALMVTAVTTVGTYLAYTLDPHTRAFFRSDWLWPSTLFVVLGVWRFVYLVRNRPHAESPTQEMLKDGPFVLVVLLWLMLVMLVVYQLRPT